MRKDKISIIVSVYNMEKYLKKCLDSIVNQTYKNLEIILINDGSYDNSPKICDEYASKDRRIKVIHKKNEGLAVARNLGIEMATGDYIGFVDADDCISCEMYEYLLKILNSNKADIAIIQFERYLEGDIPKFNNVNPEKTIIYSSNEALSLLVFDKITSHLCNKLFKKSLFADVKIPVVSCYEDVATTYLLFSQSNKIVLSNKKCYGYMINNNGITQKLSLEKIKRYSSIMNKRYNDLLKISPEISKKIDISYIQIILNSNYRGVLFVNKKEFFNNKFFINDYKLYKNLIKKYGLKVCFKDVNLKSKLLGYILYFSRNLFYHTLLVVTKARNRLSIF